MLNKLNKSKRQRFYMVKIKFDSAYLKWHYDAPLMIKNTCEKLKFKISVYFVTCVHRSILNIVSTKL